MCINKKWHLLLKYVSVLNDNEIVSRDSPEDISKQVIAGEWILTKKNTKRSRVWEQP